MTESDFLKSEFNFGVAEIRCADILIELALAEDIGEAGDITTAALVPAGIEGAANLVSREAGVIAGLPLAERLIAKFQLEKGWKPYLEDGAAVAAGQAIARFAGPVRSLLTLERVLLNFLQRLSGIATETSRFVAAVAGSKAKILDTRKTTPGWRSLEKYAVRCGGGTNHRYGLHDAILIKDNHLAWLGASGEVGDPISAAIAATRLRVPAGGFLEVEVDTLEQFDVALESRPDIILIDNLGPERLSEAVRRRDSRAPEVLLEASGGVTLSTVRSLAETGVDRISVGALTHSARALDIGLDLTNSGSQ